MDYASWLHSQLLTPANFPYVNPKRLIGCQLAAHTIVVQIGFLLCLVIKGFLLCTSILSWLRILAELFLMFSDTPGFLATPYDDCTFFQSRSRELVVFSPSIGEYVTIAWYVLAFESPMVGKGLF